MIRAALLLALLPLIGMASANTPTAKPLFDMAVNYSGVKTVPGCYKGDQAKALARAKAEGKPLMIVWGFDECSACRYFESKEMNASNPWTTERFGRFALSDSQKASLSNNGSDLEILLLRINSRTKSGTKLSKDLGIYDEARKRGGRRVWSPFITMTNPTTGEWATQGSMLPNQQPCNRWDEYAMSLEDLGYIPEDESYARRIC
jgi:hypothetical protein